MNIHQLSVRYHQEHDRLLMLINTVSGEELRLWLTRRMMLGLLPLLTGQANEQITRICQTTPLTPGTPLEDQRRAMLESFQREATAYASDFGTAYKSPEPSPGSPPPPDPLLITEIALTLLGSGQLDMKLSEKLHDALHTAREVQVAMPAQMTQGLLHLLSQGLQQSGWLEVPAQGAVPFAGPASEPLFEDDSDKPVYLN